MIPPTPEHLKGGYLALHIPMPSLNDALEFARTRYFEPCWFSQTSKNGVNGHLRLKTTKGEFAYAEITEHNGVWAVDFYNKINEAQLANINTLERLTGELGDVVNLRGVDNQFLEYLLLTISPNLDVPLAQARNMGYSPTGIRQICDPYYICHLELRREGLAARIASQSNHDGVVFVLYTPKVEMNRRQRLRQKLRI